jgi:hypothetical protein
MKAIFLPVALLALTSNAVLAADAPQRARPLSVCRTDVESLCPGVQPGHGRIAACLKENEAQVSAPCKDALAKGRERRAPAPTPTPQG